MEFIEESNVQAIDTAWRCSQGICFLKAWSQEEWWQKLLSEETFTYFSIHSYCDFLTKYWNFTSPGEVGTVVFFICLPRVTNISPLQGGVRHKPSLGLHMRGLSLGESRGVWAMSGDGSPQKQLRGLFCLPVMAWRRSWGLEGVRTLSSKMVFLRTLSAAHKLCVFNSVWGV